MCVPSNRSLFEPFASNRSTGYTSESDIEEWVESVKKTRDEARADVFDYIELFYNSKRKHGSNNLLLPVEYENRFQKRLGSV